MRFGSHVLSLDYVQVQPCCACDVPGCSPPSFTASFVKLHLYRLSVQSALTDERVLYLLGNSEQSTTVLAGGQLVRKNRSTGDHLELFYFPQNDPSCSNMWPCRLKGYARRSSSSCSAHAPTKASVDESTLVRIVPTNCMRCSKDDRWKQQLLGEAPSDPVSCVDVKRTHNPSTIAELTLRLQLLLSQPVSVGMTSDALLLFRRKKRVGQDRRHRIRLALRAHAQEVFSEEMSEVELEPEGSTTLKQMPFRDGSLLVHSPDHGAGKTLLTETVARELGASVYKIRAGSLIAKYGIHSDTALQCTIHSIAVDAAIRRKPTCVILDGLDAFLPLQRTRFLGDAANPVLQSILSYVQTLSGSIQLRREVPFPSNNQLYNFLGKNGNTLKAQFVLVATMTCPDNHVPKLLVASSTGLYRLPNLTPETRLSSFCRAFEEHGLTLTVEAREKLPMLAASAVWARGDGFDRLAATARARLHALEDSSASGFLLPLNIVENLFSIEGETQNGALGIRFGGGLFDSVGGTIEAKAALQDALALDKQRRKLLRSFGLPLPTGILLYGVPGCGKTLLARAVSKLLRNKGAASAGIGGAFVSLNSTDLVQSAVGAGEKILVSAFQEARANSPAVIFIDEFQAFFIERSSEGTGRLSSTLLQCMDDVKRWGEIESKSGTSDESDRVLVIAATNTPWMIDKAFLRPGRFDRSVCVELPNQQDREAVLSIHVKRMQSQLTDTDIKQLASEAALCGCSGADLAALCRSAAVRCLVAQSERVQLVHFREVLDDGFGASTDPLFLKKIQKWVPDR